MFNVVGTFTNFPRSDCQPTIHDLTFARGNAYSICQSWSSDESGGGVSDVTMLTTLMNLKPPTFWPKCQDDRTNWEVFHIHIKKLTQSTLNFSSAASILEAAEKIDQRIHEAMETAIPWSKPHQKSKVWWNQDISSLKKNWPRQPE